MSLAHALLLDISQPFNHDALLNVYQSVTDFLSLVTHIGGPSRVPLFGFTSTGQYAEVEDQKRHRLAASSMMKLKTLVHICCKDRAFIMCTNEYVNKIKYNRTNIRLLLQWF